MRVLVEGLDNVGKSTLITGLTKHYKEPFLHLHYYANPDKEHPLEWANIQFRNLFNILRDYGSVISDRSHIGEMVYPILYHGYDGSFIYKIEETNKDICDDIFLITLIDDPENLIERDDNQSLSTDLDFKKREIDLFIEATNKSNIKNKIIINVKDYPKDDLLKYVIDFIDSVNTKRGE